MEEIMRVVYPHEMVQKTTNAKPVEHYKSNYYYPITSGSAYIVSCVPIGYISIERKDDSNDKTRK